MRNKLNKHGPDIDIGIWFTALLRYLEAVSCLSEERTTVDVTPVKSVTDREFLKTLRHKRQRRSTIVFRRTGESPSEIAINLILNNIGSITRTSLALKVKLELMGSKTFWLNGRSMYSYGVSSKNC